MNNPGELLTWVKNYLLGDKTMITIGSIKKLKKNSQKQNRDFEQVFVFHTRDTYPDNESEYKRRIEVFANKHAIITCISKVPSEIEMLLEPVLTLSKKGYHVGLICEKCHKDTELYKVITQKLNKSTESINYL